MSSTHPIPIVPRAINSASSIFYPLLVSQILTIQTHCAPCDPPLSFLQVLIAFVRRVELTPPSSLQSSAQASKQNASNQTKQPSRTQTVPATTLLHSKSSPTHQAKAIAASSHSPSCEPNASSTPFPPPPFVPSLSRPAPVIHDCFIKKVSA